MSARNPNELSLGTYRRARALLIAGVAVLFLWNLWGYDLWAPDEPYFAEGAREMLVDGQWLVPHINGELDNHKPPLFFWLIAVLSLPFGEVSAFTARLPSVLAALVSVLLTMHLALRVGGRRVALLAGTVLPLFYLFYDKARSSQIDSLLCALILVALVAFEEFRRGALSGRTAGLIFWVSAALAVLAKGPVGLLLPLGTAILTLAFDRSLREWRSFAPLLGPAAFAAVVGAWLLALGIWPVEGYSVLAALREHFVERGLKGMHHVQPAWYYLEVLPWALFPWTLLLAGALVAAWKSRKQPGITFLLVHSLFVVVFFSISTEKQDLYVLPALPTFAILIALGIGGVLWSHQEAWSRDRLVLGSRWLRLPQGVTAGTFVVLGIAAPFVARREAPELATVALGITAILLLGGAFLFSVVLRGSHLAILQRTAATMAALLLFASAFVYPVLNPVKSGRALAAELSAAVSEVSVADRRLVAVDIGNVIRSVNFYTDGIYLELVEADELAAILESDAEILVVAHEEALTALEPRHREGMKILYSTRLSRRDLLLLRFSPSAKEAPKEER